MYLYNNIIANNSGAASGGECYNNGGTLSASTNNLIPTGSCNGTITDDPMLSALADNGGPTQTMALQENSPAINAGDNAACADANTVNNLDQRGVARPVGDTCDIGAYEFSGNPENDFFAFAYEISLPNYTSTVDTTTATQSVNDPDLENQCGISGSGQATVWYEYTPSSNTAISLDTSESGVGYDTFIAVWIKDQGNLALVACNDNGTGHASLALQVESGITYYIEIGQP